MDGEEEGLGNGDRKFLISDETILVWNYDA